MSQSRQEMIARAWVLAQPVVGAFISSIIRNNADAQDILQDVAVAILDGKSVPQSDPDFTAWAVGIARHKVADHFRRLGRRQPVMGDEVLGDVAAAFTALADGWTAEGYALEQCLGRVKGDSKELLDLRYREGYSPQEIAHRLGRTSESVRTSLLRIRRALRECIARRLDQVRGMTPLGGD